MRSSGSISWKTSPNERLRLAFNLGAKADAGLFGTVLDDFLRPANAPPQMNRILVVSIWKILVGVLAPALGGTTGHGAFDEFEQGLLRLHPTHRG